MEYTVRQKIILRRKLRNLGILPEVGCHYTKEQHELLNQIKNDDFSFWENMKTMKYEEKRMVKTQNVDFRATPENRRSYVRKRLREEGYLPPVGQSLNEEQQIIDNQIKQNDFSFFDNNVKIYHVEKPYLCATCGEDDVTKFYIHLKGTCKRCQLNKSKVRYQNGELYNSAYKNWLNRDNLIHVRVMAAKHRAKVKNFNFELTDEIIENKLKEQNGRCYYSNVEITFHTSELHCLSLDRIDSSIGYTVDNTVIVTWFINQAKSNINSEVFVNEIKLCYESMMSK
jgi:hypothetical protein